MESVPKGAKDVGRSDGHQTECAEKRPKQRAEKRPKQRAERRPKFFQAPRLDNPLDKLVPRQFHVNGQARQAHDLTPLLSAVLVPVPIDIHRFVCEKGLLENHKSIHNELLLFVQLASPFVSTTP
jgi:hypothetical protein